MTASQEPANKRLTREEVAQIELGNTTITPTTAWTLVGALLVTIFVVPVIQHVAEIGEGRVPAVWSIFATVPSEKAFSEFETELEDESVVGEWLLPRVQSVLVEAGVGNEQAYLGRDGVLYFRPGFEYVTGRPFLDPLVLRARSFGGKSWQESPQPDPRPAILGFRDDLAKRGIELVLMPTTVKPQLDPGSGVFGDGVEFPIQNPSYSIWLDEMRKAGVRVFDPGAILAETEGAFLRTDTHWAPVGMRAVAGALAAELRPLLPVASPVEYRTEKASVSNLGDIAVMLRLPESQQRYPEETVEIERVLQPDGSPWVPTADADVLFLGDSFSNIYSMDGLRWGTSAGLVETLSLELRRGIDRITINDAGAHQTRRALRDEISRGRDRLAGKKVVVWQFAIRELAVGDWKLLPLPEASSVAAAPERAAAAVRGTVTARATPPQPGSVPYRDCLIAVHLTDIAADEGSSFDGSQALVYISGMADNVWTDAAKWAQGQNIEIELVPWDDAPEAVRSSNRRDLDDDDLLLMDPWWGRLR